MNNIGLAISGGGSRAIAFHLGCFKTLDNYDLLDKIKVISSVSGGSVLAAAYCYNDYSNFISFEEEMIELLNEGLVKRGLKKLLAKSPLIFYKKIESLINGNGFANSINRTHVFAELLDELLFEEKNISEINKDLRLVINSYDLVSRSCFRSSCVESGTYKLGKVVDNKIKVSEAVAASAAYPIYLPSLNKRFNFDKGGNRRVLLVDGGIYDNSGLSLFAPYRKGLISEYDINSIIALDASHGIFGPEKYPQFMIPRFKSSIDQIMTKHQDQYKTHLFTWNNNKHYKRVAYIYLGQDDKKLPYIPDNFESNFDEMGVGTNFTALDRTTIQKLIDRGQGLSKIILSNYGFLNF